MNQPVTPERIMKQAAGVPASQAAGVEHSRAIAEVQAALAVARSCPRNEVDALRTAMESCRTLELASAAFYRFTRGNEVITDASIHLATELARVWGNIAYGIMELDRDDVNHVSEMLAYAWDLQTNTRSSQTFLVPHKRDKRGGPVVLVDMRDIYENNANNGARRLRECIFRVLPPWLKEKSKEECHGTILRNQGDTPIAELIDRALAAFARGGISRERMEAKLGPTTAWTREDIARLEVSIVSIRRGEISADEEFPRVGAEEATKAARQIADRAESSGEEGSNSQPSADLFDGGGAPTAAQFIARTQVARTLDEIEAVEIEIGQHNKAWDDETADWVDRVLNDASRRIRNTQNTKKES